MKRSGPDSLNSWIIACACCFINIMMYGMARLSGVLFVASVPRFGVSREQASFPYTFANFMRNTSGPPVGYLGHKFGVRSVTTLGCIIGGIGAGSCYFAENITTVTVLWGAVFGLGFGLGNVLIPVSINQHFDKHRATASGISFSGACLGSFILPSITEILMNNYGLSGTYLFLSGFILNCIPAALLLKKPNFEISKTVQKPQDYESETQSIEPGTKVQLYTVENGANKTLDDLKRIKNVNTSPNPDEVNNHPSKLSYEERMKRLSSQTLLSEYSIRKSTSEPLDTDQIIENSKGRRQVDPDVLESENISVSSHNTDTDMNSEKDEVFENDFRSSSVQYEKPIIAGALNKFRTLSSEDLTTSKMSASKKNSLTGYQNYGYQTNVNDFNDFKFKNSEDLSSNSKQNNSERCADSQYADNREIYFNSYQNNMDYCKPPLQNFRNISCSANISKSGFSEIDNFKVRHGKLASQEQTIIKPEETTAFGSFSVIFDPMFILIAITNAIYCFTFVCMITIIVDFARDLNVGISNEKYILMTLSVGELIGGLGLGWITDGGFMKTTNFAALCFAAQGLVTASIVWSDGFITLMILSTLYGLSEAGIIVIFPIIIAQYIDPDKQTVAIPSSNFLSGPLCLAVAPLIGYFRDTLGSYNFIFFGIGIVSFLCCLSWLLAPCILRCRRNR